VGYDLFKLGTFAPYLCLLSKLLKRNISFCFCVFSFLAIIILIFAQLKIIVLRGHILIFVFFRGIRINNA